VELGLIGERLGQQYPEDSGFGLTAILLRDRIAGPVRSPLFILLGASLMVLLVACANVVSLQLAAASGRQREVAIRLALGASRFQVIRQILAEISILAVVGACAAAVLAAAAVPVVRSIAPASIPRLGNLRVDGRVFACTLVVSVVALNLFGLLPALRVSGVATISALVRGGSLMGGWRRPGAQRILSGLIVAQIAIATVLLAGTGLLTRTFVRLLTVDFGFNPRNIIAVKLDLPRLESSRAPTYLAYEPLMARVNALPGVQSTAVATGFPLSDSNLLVVFRLEPVLYPSKNLMQGLAEDLAAGRQAREQVVSSGFFATMGMRILRGRAFTVQDTATSAPVAVINQAMADRFWPNQQAVGMRFNLAEGECLCQVIGIVVNTRFRSSEAPEPEVYRPVAQSTQDAFFLLLHTGAALSGTAIHAATGAAGFGAEGEINSIEALMSKSVTTPRFHLSLIGTYGAVSLVLAAIGLCGSVSHAVNRRQREIGIRLAIGADPSSVRRLILKQGMMTVVVGSVIGIGVALATTRLIASMLFGISPTDPLTFILVPTVFALVSFAACYAPARRASRIDPVQTLRQE
jgi:putative ABC transport system permease protein